VVGLVQHVSQGAIEQQDAVLGAYHDGDGGVRVRHPAIFPLTAP